MLVLCGIFAREQMASMSRSTPKPIMPGPRWKKQYHKDYCAVHELCYIAHIHSTHPVLPTQYSAPPDDYHPLVGCEAKTKYEGREAGKERRKPKRNTHLRPGLSDGFFEAPRPSSRAYPTCSPLSLGLLTETFMYVVRLACKSWIFQTSILVLRTHLPIQGQGRSSRGLHTYFVHSSK
jgi:hypothetical protein